MNRERLNTWLALTASVGVIVGLIIVALELNQNADLMRIQISQSRADAAIKRSYVPDIDSPFCFP